MKNFYLFLSCILLSGLCAFGESRTWTNTKGKTLEGEFVKATKTTVSVKLDSGKTVRIKIKDLSEEDQAFVAQAQEEAEAAKEAQNDEEDDEAKSSSKKSSSFRWAKRLNSTLEKAKEEDLPVMVLFTGTSWCGFCVKLEDEVLSKREFKRLASGKMLGVKYECPSAGKYETAEGDKMAKKYNVRGVPHYIILNKDGEQIGSGGYHSGITPKSLVDSITKAAKK